MADAWATGPARTAVYGELTRRLSLEHPHDIVSYIRGKDSFIKALLEDARRWQARVAE